MTLPSSVPFTRRGLLTGALGTGALLALPTPAAAEAAEAIGTVGTGLRLPPPTGRFRVGTTVAHLVDSSRPDPFAPVPQARELMVQAWYPATVPPGCRTAAYLAPATAAVIGPDFGIPPDLLSSLRLPAAVDAPPRRRPGGYPVVLFSPGLGLARSSCTSLVTDLASHGYVVIAIDHTYDSHAVEFPDGRVVVRAVDEGGDPSVKSGYVAVRSADARFIADQLRRPGGDRHWRTVRAVADVGRLGMAGHSIGGATAADVLQDARFTAGVDLDGSIYDPAADRPTHQPFLLLGGDYHHRGNDFTWARFWAGLTGWHRDLGVTGLGHYDLTDFRPFADQLGLTGGVPPEIFGPIGGERALTVVRVYLRAVFDLHLGGTGGDLFDHPSARYPEAVLR